MSINEGLIYELIDKSSNPLTMSELMKKTELISENKCKVSAMLTEMINRREIYHFMKNGKVYYTTDESKEYGVNGAKANILNLQALLNAIFL